MKGRWAIIQRVLSASVTVDNQIVSEIGNGILVFAAIAPDDTPKDVEWMANRILKLKVWDAPDGGRWKRSVTEEGYQVLLVSQFTLLANTKKGNKPDFHGACPPGLAEPMFSALIDKTRQFYVKARALAASDGPQHVQAGVFGAMMQVGLINDGPVTFEISTPAKGPSSGSGTPKGSANQKPIDPSAAEKVETALKETRISDPTESGESKPE